MPSTNKKQTHLNIEHILIVNGLFERIDFERLFNYKEKKDMNISTMYNGLQVIHASTADESIFYIFLYKCGIKISPLDTKDKNTNIAKFEAVFEVTYSANEKLSNKALQKYLNENIKDDIWENWIEFIRSSCKNMNIPMIPIPEK